MGTAFPLLSYGENAWERCCIVTKLSNTVPLGHKHILLKMHFAVQKVVFLTLKYGKTRWRPALCLGPRWGSLRRSPDPLVGWGGDTPPQNPHRSAPSTLRSRILAFPFLLLIYEMTTALR